MNPFAGVSHIYFSQRLRLHYMEWPHQNPDAPTMVLVHGMQDHCRTWDALAARFSADFRIIAPDLRGHGDSEWVRGAAYQYLDFVYDLHQLIEQADLAPVTLVGHSLGGAITALFAGIYPELVERLVVIEGIGLWNSAQPQVPVAEATRDWVTQLHALSARQPRRYPTLQDAYERMQQANPQLSREQAMHLTAHGSNQNEDGTYSWKYDNYIFNFSPGSLDEQLIRQIWENIAAPVLIVNAEHGLEHRLGQDGSLQYFKQAELHDLPATGHWTYHDDLDGVVELMHQFLQF